MAFAIQAWLCMALCSIMGLVIIKPRTTGETGSLKWQCSAKMPLFIGESGPDPESISGVLVQIRTPEPDDFQHHRP